MKKNYYEEKLNSNGLMYAYETSIPRIKQYLAEEINFTKKMLSTNDTVLELGAGYGRIMKELASNCKEITGIDISANSVSLSKEYLKNIQNANVVKMNVHKMSLEQIYDKVICLQNGLSSMNIESSNLIDEILKLVKLGGKAIFSTYSDRFWEYRVKWFKEQADKKLLGELDLDKTKDGIIVCKDGFRAITYTKEDLKRIGEKTVYKYEVVEVDESSLFLIITKTER